MPELKEVQDKVRADAIAEKGFARARATAAGLFACTPSGNWPTSWGRWRWNSRFRAGTVARTKTAITT